MEEDLSINSPYGPDEIHELNEQSKLVLELMYFNLEHRSKSLSELSNRGLNLLQSGSFILALAATASIIVGPISFSSNWQALGLAVVVISFIVMLITSILAWIPLKLWLPSETENLDSLLDNYLNVRVGPCYLQIIADIAGVMANTAPVGARKARLIQISAFCLAIQVAGILMLAISQNKSVLDMISSLSGWIQNLL